ncbi:DUF6985 domain-containing protein [Cerasicoccus fimbriatus]|uniref:DUF6985 domain-containing protein n=1 Tax=Cerasicoccus fimbriatus TaxID=3014554 RepID=UPI0022B4BBC0|nr:hypothetical protein [Cerasicoccus sp. TK19100]
MKKEQFTRDGSYGFQVYSWEENIKTDIGEFGVEIQIMDGSSLDQQLLDMISTLIETGKTKTLAIRDHIYASYKAFADEQPEYLEDLDIPTDLTKNQVMEHVDSMNFVVLKDPEAERTLDSFIHVRPIWDEEHTLYIRCEINSLTVFDPMSGE